MLRTDVCGRFCRLLAYAATTVLTMSLVSSPITLYGADYPVIFTSSDQLRTLGIALGWEATHFQNKCYNYGDGGYLTSISNEFLARFKSRGFTVESVCLGLVSQTRYDPETGRRLPTYIIADEQEVTRQLREHGELSEGSITEEMPLDLPGCFRNGTPYNDCVFRFGRKTGKVLTAAETATYAELGAALDKWTRAIIAAGNYAADKLWDCDGHRPCSDLGFRKPSAYYLNSYSSERCPRKLPDCHEPMLTDNVVFSGIKFSDWQRLSRYSSVQWWVRSSKLARGYGYALDANGEADPGLSADSVKAAMDNLSKSQINVEELGRRLNAR